MKTPPSLACFAAVLLLSLYFGSANGRKADAQAIPNAVATPRYQISAWAFAGNPSSPTPKHGYYIVDTVTGELWESDANDRPIKVSSKLP
jgi:hypothetical protein